MAAQSQLETAIKLWFQNDDPIAIHALASAAHDLLNLMSSQIGKPSEWEAALEEMPDEVRSRARYFQNFIKHGFKDLKGDVEYGAQHGELLMFFAIDCYANLFPLTPLMHLFVFRLLVENPEFRTESGQRKVDQFGPYHSDQISRQDFLDHLLPVMERRLHSGSPPEKP